MAPKVYIERAVPALARVVNGQLKHARVDLVLKTQWFYHVPGCCHCVSFFQQPGPHCSSQGHMAKRAEKTKCDRYPHIDKVILDTAGRPGHHAKKFIGKLMKEADNPPLAIRDTRSAVESVLHSASSKQQLTAARYVTTGPLFT